MQLKNQLLECIDDMNAFNKVYNNKTSTNFGYFVPIHHLIQVRHTILVYGTINKYLSEII
jgi:hypothetical protein